VFSFETLLSKSVSAMMEVSFTLPVAGKRRGAEKRQTDGVLTMRQQEGMAKQRDKT
jgi:hypothetical protein